MSTAAHVRDHLHRIWSLCVSGLEEWLSTEKGRRDAGSGFTASILFFVLLYLIANSIYMQQAALKKPGSIILRVPLQPTKTQADAKPSVAQPKPKFHKMQEQALSALTQKSYTKRFKQPEPSKIVRNKRPKLEPQKMVHTRNKMRKKIRERPKFDMPKPMQEKVQTIQNVIPTPLQKKVEPVKPKSQVTARAIPVPTEEGKIITSEAHKLKAPVAPKEVKVRETKQDYTPEVAVQPDALDAPEQKIDKKEVTEVTEPRVQVEVELPKIDEHPRTIKTADPKKTVREITENIVEKRTAVVSAVAAARRSEQPVENVLAARPDAVETEIQDVTPEVDLNKAEIEVTDAPADVLVTEAYVPEVKDNPSEVRKTEIADADVPEPQYERPTAIADRPEVIEKQEILKTEAPEVTHHVTTDTFTPEVRDVQDQAAPENIERTKNPDKPELADKPAITVAAAEAPAVVSEPLENILDKRETYEVEVTTRESKDFINLTNKQSSSSAGTSSGASGMSTRGVIAQSKPKMPAWLEAKGGNPGGTFKIVVGPTGAVLSVDVESTTGYRDLDLHVISTIMKDWKYEAGEGQYTDVVDVEFKLTRK